MSETDARMRVNLLISRQAYDALLEMAGGERRMGLWLDATILDIYHNRMPHAAVFHLAQARDYLNKFFEAREAHEAGIKKAGS